MKTKLLVVLSAVLTSMAMTPSLGFAQSQEYEIEEIVVTAQKREQRAFDVPLAIDAYQESTLENADLIQFRDIGMALPKLTTASNFGPFGSVLSSRGISGSTNLEPVVASYIDDVPYAFVGTGWAPSGRLFDLDRVEVLNGPQGTLFGQGSMGGAIRVFTRDPELTEFAGTVRLNMADVKDGEEDFGGDVMLNVPLVAGKLGARLVYSREETGGFINYPNVVGSSPEDLDDVEYEDLRFKLLYAPSERTDIRFTVWLSEIGSEISQRVPYPVPDDPRTEPSPGTLGIGDVESETYSLFFSHDFGSFTLSNTFSKFDVEQLQRSLLGGIDGFADPYTETTSNELRLVSSFDGPFQFVLGHYYWDSSGGFAIAVALIPPIIPAGRLFLGHDLAEFDSEISAFFGEVSYEFADGFAEVLVGIRRFEDDRSFVAFNDAPFVQGDGFVQTTDIGDTFNNTSTRFNLTLRPTDNWIAFLNIAEGYRSGTFNIGLSATAGELAGFPGELTTIQPDEVVSYDIGTKYRSEGGLFSMELVAFISEWKDAQQLVTFNPAIFVSTIVNAGNLDIQGFEYDFGFQFTDSFSMNLQGAYVDTEWKSLADLLDVFAGLREGGPSNGVPKHQLLVSGTYTRLVTLGGRELELSVYGDYRAYSERSDATGGGIKTNDTRQSTLRIGVGAPESWELALFANNLTDEDEAIGVAFSVIATPPRPRQVGVTFTKHF